MKKLLFTILFISAFALSAFAQTDIEVANQRINKLVEELNAKDVQIEKLNKVVKELQDQVSTPCSVALKSTTENVQQAHDFLGKSDPEDKKAWLKTLDFRRKQAKKIVESQCNLKGAGFKDFIKNAVIQYLPVAILLIGSKK